MSALVDFLNARLDEDEAIARAASNEDAWMASTRSLAGTSGQVRYATPTGPVYLGTLVETGPYADAVHIARHDPARALREVSAKRAILNRRATHDGSFGDDEWTVGRSDENHETLRTLAVVYSDHPDYAKALAE